MMGRPAAVCAVCNRRVRDHFRGICVTPAPARAEESVPRLDATRAQLWAVVDAAFVLLVRATSGRIGSQAYTNAAERLELELARLPEGSCPGKPPQAPPPA
jgi:hypothetical protein